MNDFEQKKRDILSECPPEIKESIQGKESQGGFFFKVDTAIVRLIKNPYMSDILAFIQSRYDYNIKKGFDKGGYVCVTMGDIQNNLRIAKGTISTSVNKLIKGGILKVRRETSNIGNFIYYKPDHELLNFLRLEDTIAWNTCVLNGIEPTPKEMDRRCPNIVIVRNMINRKEKENDKIFAETAEFVKENPHLIPWLTRCLSGVNEIYSKPQRNE